MKFDEFNNIEVPEEVDVFIKNGVKKAEKVKQKRRIKKWVSTQGLSINVEISHSERVLDSILQNKGRKI